MKFIICILFALFIPKSYAIAQGFDWTYSWRLPSESPTLFAGVGYASTLMNKDNAGYSTFDNQLTCCKYDQGIGNNDRLFFLLEQWYQGNYAVQGSIAYSMGYSRFTQSRIDNFIDSSGLIQDLYREFILEAKWKYLDIGLLCKSRISETHLSIAAGLTCSIPLYVSANHTVNARVKGDESNIIYPPSTPIKIQNAGIVISPTVRFEYDQEIAKGAYCKPFIQVEYTLLSRVTSGDPWRSFALSAGIAICRGLN